jgi:hypothetical protein
MVMDMWQVMEGRGCFWLGLWCQGIYKQFENVCGRKKKKMVNVYKSGHVFGVKCITPPI